MGDWHEQSADHHGPHGDNAWQICRELFGGRRGEGHALEVAARRVTRPASALVREAGLDAMLRAGLHHLEQDRGVAHPTHAQPRLLLDARDR
jgi:hypothetical protein